MTEASGQTTRYRRRGSAYMVVIGSALLVTVISLSSLTVARIFHRASESSAELTQARFHAQSVVEAVVGVTVTMTNWRTTWGVASGDTYGPIPFGPGQCSLSLVDEVDGDLTNDVDDPVRIIGTGQVGQAVYHCSALAKPAALECLRKALSGVELIWLDSGATLTVSGAPVQCHRGAGSTALIGISSGATINADIETQTLWNQGNLNGSSTTISEALELPPSSTIDYYRSLATPIARTALDGDDTIKKVVLSHDSNPYGATNADGLYYIDMADKDMKIEDCRIEATLVIDLAANKRVQIQKGVYWVPHRSDYPALIVAGGEDIEIKIENPLDEHDIGVNFNPPGMPFEGQSDSDKDDVYPGIIKGLIHVADGRVVLAKLTEIEGAVVGGAYVFVQDTVTITHNPNLVLNPPRRYRTARLNLVEGTWRRVTSP